MVTGMRPSAPFMTPALRTGILFAVKQAPDYLAFSFVSDAADILSARGVMQGEGADIPIVAKIERQDAVANFDRILEVVEPEK